MSDIVKRLRDYSPVHWSIMHEAANEITRLRAENKRLREALKYYAATHKFPDDGPWGANSDDFGTVARQALKGAVT